LREPGLDIEEKTEHHAAKRTRKPSARALEAAAATRKRKVYVDLTVLGYFVLEMLGLVFGIFMDSRPWRTLYGSLCL
jgi:hypothetical protein